jgi:hypothetical protein
LETKPGLPRDRAFCVRCHAYNASRPTGFPQIDPATHNAPMPCVGCHDPHAPVPPVVPGDCGACHGSMARQKAVSRHAALSCTTCHPTPEAHKVSPRTARPGKPVERAFCGGCHAEDAESPGYIPRIDLQAHNPRYLCWQCHYPHMPETN